MIEEVQGEDYTITYNRDEGTVYFKGIFRLSGSEGYRPIAEFLDRILASGVNSLVLDLRELVLLNSSGITTLSRFVIHARQYEHLALKMRGSQAVFWQERSLGNLQRLHPRMELDWD